MKAYLKTLNWIFKLQPKRTTVGRHKDSHLCLQNGGVDDLHATIEWNEVEHCYVLTDLNSVHGTYVNDCRIHNAAVRLTPGDELHFGYGGATYELILDTADALPVLPVQTSARVRAQTHSPPVTPHPPSRPRPASAGAKRTTQIPKAFEPRGHYQRAGSWSSSTGREQSLKNVSTSCSMQDLLQDKEDGSVRQGVNLSGVNVCEGENQRKECVIMALRDEVAALRLQLSQSSQADSDIRHKLSNLATGIQEKKQEIQQLKEQMLEIQNNCGEQVAQAIAEREQRISTLKEQLTHIKNEKSRSTALVNSLQKDLLSREKQTLKLAAEVDKLRQEVRYKEAQLSNMANKLSQRKEAEKHHEEYLAREKEVESLKKTMEKLDMTLHEKQKELNQQITEMDALKHRQLQMIQEQANVQTEMNRLKMLQQNTRQREEEMQTELRHTQIRLENLCSQITKRILLTSETVSEQEVLEHLLELAEQKEMFSSRVKELEQKLQEHTENQRLMEEDTVKLKGRLSEWQSSAQEVVTVDAIQSQITALQEESVCHTVRWVQTLTLSLLTTLHTLLQDFVNTLQTAGIEVSENTGGISGAIQTLCQQYREIQSELRTLKAEKKQLQEREDLASDLQESLETMKQELEEQKLQAAERLAEMDNTVKLQLRKMKSDLESAKAAEVALRLEMETQEAEKLTKLEEACKKESELRQRVREREQQVEEWREKMKEQEQKEKEWQRRVEEALQTGAVDERERVSVEIQEYREQVRQHAHTIVAMEKQVSRAQQRERELQEDRDSVMHRLTEALSRLEDDKPSISSEESKQQEQQEQTILSLRTSLEAAQQEVVRQGEVITSLSRDLAQAHARLSDLTGELSEQQKIELETHRALVVEQRMQLSMLSQKLTDTSQLLEQKNEELKTLKEKQIQMEMDLKSQKEGQDYGSHVPMLQAHQTKDVALMVSPSDLFTHHHKGKGHRHEEILRQQKETLFDMRARVRAIEQKFASKLLGQEGEPVRQNNTLRPLRSAAQRASITSMSGFAFPEALSEVALERTARLDMSDALELSERTYLDLARALCEVLELSDEQLSGCVPLKNVPPAEREHLTSLRQDDLELFRKRLALQNSQSQNTLLLLQQSQSKINTLSESLAAGQQLQVELDNVHAELEAVKQESSALHQALQLTQTQLLQHRDQRSAKNHKALNMEGRTARVGHHNCVPNDKYDKVPVLKRRQQKDRRRSRTEAEVDTVKNESTNKEQAICKMAAQLTSLPQQQQSVELTEAH
ncbi:forkhead-associated domain-containing protein 1 [Hoplias malabaricus]|uniref:forkhead-associated domain-containing protein 1 n=1 Tax=Hoplias malabaricus TaxID=27720 RepID=UPI003462D7A6